MAAKNTQEVPAVEAEGVTIVDNTGAEADRAAPAAVAEEYELTPGLVQVNYV